MCCCYPGAVQQDALPVDHRGGLAEDQERLLDRGAADKLLHGQPGHISTGMIYLFRRHTCEHSESQNHCTPMYLPMHTSNLKYTATYFFSKADCRFIMYSIFAFIFSVVFVTITLYIMFIYIISYYITLICACFTGFNS